MRDCKLLFLIFPLFLMLAGCSFLPMQSDTDFYGLLIGIEDYDDINIFDLNFCIEDVDDMRSALIYYGWKTSELIILTDLTTPRATKNEIITNLTNIVAQADENDFIFVYFSGHGTFINDTNGDEADGYDEALIPVDYQWGDVTSLITDDELGNIFETQRTEKGIFIIDACHSGGVINKSLTGSSMKVKSIDGINPKGSGASGDLNIANFPVMAACSQSEVSYEDSPTGPFQHGIFSYYLLDGLNNLKADRNNDNYITIRELFNYAEINTEIYTSKYAPTTQHPVMRFPMDFIDILITRERKK